MVCILIFTSERKREREKNIYVRKERNKRKIVSGSDGMQATPHRLPLLVLSEKIKEREVEKGTLETDYVSEIFDSRKGKSRIILGEDYRL